MNHTSQMSEFAARLASRHAEAAEAIRKCAHDVHTAVNQFYNGRLPYGFHLDMVADGVLRYASPIVRDDDDVLPVYFGAYFHDSIEDARLTYNDVTSVARQFMDASQALTAAEIVYALTNEKGRTRAERADARYYAGIRATPYAPMVKLADRLANMTFSARNATDGSTNSRMRRIYADELPHFLQSISPAPGDGEPDARLCLPELMVKEVCKIANQS